MENKVELLINLIEISENIRHDRRKHHNKDIKKGERHERHEKCEKHEQREKPREKLSFTAKKLICTLLKEKKINQRNLSKILGISAQAMSEIIKKLQLKEIIVKEQGELNNENIISLTEKGEQIAKHTDEKMRKLSINIFADFTSEELENLEYLINKMASNNAKILEFEGENSK